MKKTMLLTITFIISVATVWFTTRTYYKIKYFEIAKEHYTYREVMYCESLRIESHSEEEAMINDKFIEGCRIAVGMLVDELDKERTNVIVLVKTPEEAYKDARSRTIDRMRMFQERANNPLTLESIIPQELRELLRPVKDGL